VQTLIQLTIVENTSWTRYDANITSCSANNSQFSKIFFKSSKTSEQKHQHDLAPCTTSL